MEQIGRMYRKENCSTVINACEDKEVYKNVHTKGVANLTQLVAALVQSWFKVVS